jgi:hypothetical protein
LFLYIMKSRLAYAHSLVLTSEDTGMTCRVAAHGLSEPNHMRKFMTPNDGSVKLVYR